MINVKLTVRYIPFLSNRGTNFNELWYREKFELGEKHRFIIAEIKLKVIK